MPQPTWDPIEEKILVSAAPSVTFNSISGTYKDLVLEFVGTTSVNDNIYLRFNGDTAANYSYSTLRGNGTNATSNRGSSVSTGYVTSLGVGTAIFTVYANVMSYANGSVEKTTLSRYSDAGNTVGTNVMLWRSTNAITSIVVSCASGNFLTSSTFRLWGVAG